MLKLPLSSKAFAILSLGFLLVMLSVGIAACGYPTTGSTAPSPTATVQVQKCGVVQTGPGPRKVPTNDDLAKQATDCFWKAFQQCRPANLIYRAGGVDTIVVRTFTIQNNNGKCSITDAAEHFIVPHPTPVVSKAFTCAGVTQQADGLHFSACGEDGDVVVPSTGA
jgi:hypothetical protein